MQPGIITGICRGNIRTIEIYKRFWGSTEAVVNKVQGAQTIGTSQTSMKTPSREHILNFNVNQTSLGIFLIKNI